MFTKPNGVVPVRLPSWEATVDGGSWTFKPVEEGPEEAVIEKKLLGSGIRPSISVPLDVDDYEDSNTPLGLRADLGLGVRPPISLVQGVSIEALPPRRRFWLTEQLGCVKGVR